MVTHAGVGIEEKFPPRRQGNKCSSIDIFTITVLILTKLMLTQPKNIVLWVEGSESKYLSIYRLILTATTRVVCTLCRLIAYNARNGPGPKSISDVLECYEATRALRPPGTSLLSVPRVPTLHGEAALSLYTCSGTNFQGM